MEEREARGALDIAREEQEQQRLQINRDLSDALVEVAGSREKSRAAPTGDAEPWNQFRAALRRAEALAGSPLADAAFAGRVRDLQSDLKQDEADRRMVARLEEIPLSQAASPFIAGVSGSLRPLYKAAFNEYGLPVFNLDLDEAARRIAASRIRDRLVVALDNCAENFWDLMNRLIPIIQRVEKDKSPWVRAYYDARLRNDRKALVNLAKQPEAIQQLPSTICQLCGWVFISYDSKTAIALLREAHLRYPGDFRINHMLGKYVPGAEAIAFYRAALAARPESPALRSALAGALLTFGNKDEAIAQYRHVVQARPDSFAYLELGTAQWTVAGNEHIDEVIGVFRKAVEADSKSAIAYAHLAVALRAKGDTVGATPPSAAWSKSNRVHPVWCMSGLARRFIANMLGTRRSSPGARLSNWSR